MTSARRGMLALTLFALMIPTAPAVARAIPSPHLEAGVLDGTWPAALIARFDDAIPASLGTIAGLDVRYRFTATPAVFVEATADAARALAAMDGLAYLERDQAITFALDTATKASRAREVFDPAYRPTADPALTDADGNPIDGRGIGIAVVDSGLDGTHPDFQQPGKVAGNYVVTPEGLIEAPYTNLAQAHGTHVAGIAAGNGLSSGGLNRGAAPGASLYAFGIGPAGSIAFASIAFDWILTHGDTQDPPIRVVTNSWGCGGVVCTTFNPDQIHNTLATQLAETGHVVTFAVGNDGGEGWISTVNAEATNQTPGIIGVANYNDQDSGQRALCISSSSSRGASRDPSTWPDLAAPGTKIMSTWPIGPDANTRVPDGSRNYYREMSGTSMATPHVAGIAALLLQARPDLSPADIEYLLKATATKLSVPQPCHSSFGKPRLGYLDADPSHPYDGANYESGHGLVDAYAAVARTLTFTAIPPAPEPAAIPDDFIVAEESVTVTDTLYMRGDGTLSPGTPTAAPTVVHPIAVDAPATFTTAPFTDQRAIDGFTVDAWVGTLSEACETSMTAFSVRAQINRIPAGGDAEKIAAGRRFGIFTCPVVPYQRDFIFTLDEPLTFYTGDRLSVDISIAQTAPLPAGPTPSPVGTGLLYTDTVLTPSRVGLGTAVDIPEAGSPEECLARQDCAEVTSDSPTGDVVCGGGAFAVEWTGPPGTGIAVSCSTGHIACVVAGLPGDPEGTCRGEEVVGGVFQHNFGTCVALAGPGAPGKGRCIAVKFLEDDGQQPA